MIFIPATDMKQKSVEMEIIFQVLNRFQKYINYRPIQINFYYRQWGTGCIIFRVKQVYLNRYIRYSTIRQLALENSCRTKFSIYPNPSMACWYQI